MDNQVVQSILINYGYSVVQKVGAGAFSTCYLVVDEKYKRQFICKVIEVPNDNDHAITVKRSYYNEVNALVECIHPNVIKIYNNFIERNMLFIILEYCSGGSIDKLIQKKGPLKESDLFNYTLEFAYGLSYCHSMGIANHDIKPANLLLDEFNKLKIADFGFASIQKYVMSDYMGSLAFMAPEKISKYKYNPFLSDVWSFGITLYYLATGNLPFYGINSKDLKRCILGCTYQIPKTVTKFAQTIIMKTLLLKPADRWMMNDVVKFLRLCQSKYISPNKSTSDIVLKTIVMSRSTKLNKRSSAPRLSSSSLLVSSNDNEEAVDNDQFVI
ncbi:CAMK family protein kinase [Trichomonas vaginalis G3]|uniref:CAMK family protein kinase n=1 Tax=Trichomonas vaginalis (strain ATCC PRA-98 / G3) TaxID=412133 RepID=A2FKX4_TRIV3|nr:protein serine/threonine kinase protein [Trichomonas vaginalis G3]EAX94428.1 CAMK family protein kinase [Trichomonas vaginalis G3]KAI5550435.1 protein serine/threonine kinase protein [Trichomonas vaginalis G3]|eukprot:XP_001307358.1 CAMK family protein kinase [Trichomonas vaginalis G3]